MTAIERAKELLVKITDAPWSQDQIEDDTFDIIAKGGMSHSRL